MEKTLSFSQLRKLSKQQLPGAIGKKLLIMGDCATQHLSTAVKGCAASAGINLEVIDTDYNLIDAMTIDETSQLYSSTPDFVLIHMCTEKLQEKFRECVDKTDFAQKTAAQIQQYWNRISGRLNSSILMFTFVELDDGVFGHYGCKRPESFGYQLRKVNFLLCESAAQHNNVFLIDLNRIAARLGAERFRDPKLYYTAKMPISPGALPHVAAGVVEVMQAICGRIKKCLILDLDNTLWGGVIGDDGLQGIQIGELGVGHAFEALQHWIKDLKERGIILAVCSKNNEDTAKLPFEKHPEMVLRLEDISVFVANWEDKASNIRMIQKVLNIGMDSMVFLDDNPFERQLVRSMLPEVTVPELPEDPSLYLDYLLEQNLFETASFSATDKDRTKQYQAEMQRVSQQKQFGSYDEYLKSLEMAATAAPFDSFQVPRIAQLTQRSNQFNLRTIRCTEEDVLRIMQDEKYITLYFTLTDKFGDHGLISLVILEKQDRKTLFIHNWLMSCRVLKRGMEAFILNTVIAEARARGFRQVVGEYIKTPKNAMVEKIYQDYGFVQSGENRYLAAVDTYSDTQTYIKAKENTL